MLNDIQPLQIPLIVLGGLTAFLLLVALYTRWSHEQPARELRRVMRAEVDENLKKLMEYWARLRPRENEDELHSAQKVGYARELVLRDLPQFSRIAYASQSAVLPVYLSRGELRRLAQFYVTLEQLEGIQQQLREARAADLARVGAGDDSASHPDTPPAKFEEFMRIAAQSFDRARHLCDAALAEGNPLGKQPR